jgi:hypothetical protein
VRSLICSRGIRERWRFALEPRQMAMHFLEAFTCEPAARVTDIYQTVAVEVAK